MCNFIMFCCIENCIEANTGKTPWLDQREKRRKIMHNLKQLHIYYYYLFIVQPDHSSILKTANHQSNKTKITYNLLNYFQYTNPVELQHCFISSNPV